MKIIYYAKIASAAWEDLSEKKRSKFKEFFHLRPTNTGITIVSVLPEAPMRGCTGLKTKGDLSQKLESIYRNYNKLVSVDDSKVKDTLVDLGFKIRKEKQINCIMEEDIQANIIRNMSKDDNLRDLLDAERRVSFVASEFIFEQGKNRLDIIGFDGDELYLFEVKKDRTTKEEQLKDYVDYYKGKASILKEILKNYPMNKVSDFNGIKGVMVMGYAENSNCPGIRERLEEEFGLKTIFYEISLRYR